jgi:hypothetical protein
LHRRLFLLVLEKRQVLSNIYQRPVLVDCYGQYRHKYIDFSEAARAKARGMTPKRAQPGVKDAIHPRSKDRGILAFSGKNQTVWLLRGENNY